MCPLGAVPERKVQCFVNERGIEFYIAHPVAPGNMPHHVARGRGGMLLWLSVSAGPSPAYHPRAMTSCPLRPCHVEICRSSMFLTVAWAN
eukprot:484370-Pyramimonas_sp.AAC.1